MKRFSFLIVLVMCAAFAMAQNGRIDLSNTSKAECIKSDMTSLEASFSFSSIEAKDCPTEKGLFSWISLPNTVLGGNEGDPQVPVVSELIAVPIGARPRIEVTSFSSTDYRLADYGIHTLVPRQPSLRKDINPENVPFVYNASAYQTRGLASAPRATVNVDGLMRGIQVGKISIDPVSYDPVNNTLRVFNDIKVKVYFDGADAQATEDLLLSTYSPYFDIIYAQMFNGRSVLDVYTDHPDLYTTPVKMIVITTSTYSSNSTFQNWVNWKKQKGIYTTVYTTSQTGTTASAIKTFIRNKYNTDAPTFVVIVGDKDDIPASLSSNTTGKVTDLYYSSTTDTDLYPEMFLSRMPISSTTELANLLNKIMTYEQYTMSNPSYLDETLLIAGWDNYWTNVVGKPTIQYANNNYFNTAHGITPHVFITTGSNQTSCYSYINNVGFVNYTAHGDNTMWYDPQFTTSNVNSMTNNGKYLWAVGNCCLAANWGYSGTCLAEAFLRVANKGAFGYIGSCPETYWWEDYYFGVGAFAANYSGSTPSVSGTTTGCYDAMFDDTGFNTLNSVPFIGNLAVAYAHANNYQYSTTDKYYWEAYHCLGDGSVMPYLKVPAANVVSHASTFPSGATSFSVSAVPGSYVAITQNNEIIGVAVVPSSGTVSVPVTPVTSGNVMIVVTRQQRQPYITTIPVSSGSSQYTITVSANPTAGGSVTGGGTFNAGTTHTVTATANTGYTFVNWTENGNVVSTNASYTFTLTSNRNLVANFNAQTFTITATANPAAGGSVNVGGRSTTTEYNYNFENGYQGWTTLQGNSGTSPHNWMHNSEYTAYDANQDQIDVSEGHNSSSGMMLSESYISAATPGGSAIGAVTPDNYLVSPQIRLGGSITFYAASRMSNYPAEKFSVLVSESGNNSTSYFTHTELTVTLSNNNWQSYTVDLSDYSGMGYVAIRHHDCYDQHLLYIDDITIVEGTADPSSSSGTFNYGQSCTVSATPNSGYTFVNWTENGNVVSTNANYTFTVTSNRNLVANFSQQLPTYTVSVSANPTNGGTVTGGGSFQQGQSCTVHATAATGYTFTNWTENGTVVSSNANYSFTVNGNRNLVAHFTANGYTISVSANPSAGGTVTGGGSYTYGQSCTVHATAATGYTFTNWTENGSVVSTNANYTFTVNANRTLVAHFTANGYTISVSANPSAGGTVTGGGSYTYGQSCTVHATAATGYTFTNWTENGNVVSTNANYTFTVNANRTLVAHFTANSYTISVSANPTAGGSVSGGGVYTYGQSCTVHATAASGYTFINWTENGSYVSSNANYTFTVNANRNLKANFTANPQPTYTISVSANPTNGGSVTGGGTYQQGQSCTVTAMANNGYTFNNWTENGTVVSNNASYSFTVTANRTLVAHFTANPTPNYTITLVAKPANGGIVAGGGTYQQGQSCTVTATPATGFVFDKWTENDVQVSTNANYTFTVTGNRTLAAYFSAITYTINATADPVAGGTIAGTGSYEYGSQATLKAFPNDNYIFQNWTENGVIVSTSQYYTFTVTGGRNLIAHFQYIEGVNENANTSFNLYPNPVSNKLTIEASETIDRLEVFNITGALVISQKDCTDKVEINTVDLPAGTYVIRLTTPSATETRRFVKE